MGLRDTMQERPWIGWTVVGVLIVIGAVLLVRQIGGGDPTVELSQDVTLRYEDTGDEQKVNRGQFESLLMQLSAKGELKIDEGMTNPKTGKKTGFPVDRAYWDRIVPAILEARRQHNEQRGANLPGGNRR